VAQEKDLTADELMQFSRAVVAIQNACLHEHVREDPQVIDGQRFYMRQCEDCCMFNPPAPTARDQSQGGATDRV